jgi:flagellar biosynthetic protein FlhB
MMSDNDDLKQHEATSRRMDDMRERGQTLRSKDLSSGLILAAALIMLVFLSETIKAQFENNFILAFTSIPKVISDPEQLIKIFESVMLGNFLMLIPVMILLMCVVFGSVFILGGWNFSIKSLSFKWSNINPLVNLPNIFSSRMLVDVSKSSIKFTIITGFFAYFVISNDQDILSLSYLPMESSFGQLYALIEKFILVLFIGILIIISIDAIYSYLSYQSRSRMTTQELKDEHKDTEGNVDIKRRMKSLQFALIKQKIPQMVPQATVVITNPQHYAIALRYKDGIDKAPKVIAKGKGTIAQHIRKLAISHSIPVYEEPPLARAIYHTSKLGSDINPGLYMAVAIVLSYIHQLRRYQHGQGPLPAKSAVELPPQFQFKS